MSNMILFNPRPGYTFTVLYLKRNSDVVKRMINRHTPNRVATRIWKKSLIPVILLFLSFSSYAQKDSITFSRGYLLNDFIEYYGGAYIKIYIESAYRMTVSKLNYTLDNDSSYHIEEKNVAYINTQDSSVILSDTVSIVLNLARRLLSTNRELNQLYINLEDITRNNYEMHTNRYQLEQAARELYNILPKSLQDSKQGRNMANTLISTNRFNRLNPLK